MISSITKLNQVCSEKLCVKVLERGLGWEENIRQVIKVRTDELVNGNYVNIAEKEFQSYQEYFHDAYCSQAITHGQVLFYVPGEITCGHYKITFKKGFYTIRDPQFVQCDDFNDQDILYLP